MDKKEIRSEDVRSLYTENYFLENATGHSEFMEFKGRFEDLIDKFQFIVRSLELNQNHSLLDIGCGRGEIVIYHALSGGDATGVDFSEDAIKIAKEKARELKAGCSFQVSSFENIPEEKQFDRIVAIDFIEHISVQEGKKFFEKCRNLLKPGGRLLVYTYPNTIRRKYGYKLIRLSGFLRNKPVPEKEPDTVSEHYKQYHLNEQNHYTLKRSASDAGFSKIKVLYFDKSIKDSFIKTALHITPLRHLFLKGLTLIADR